MKSFPILLKQLMSRNMKGLNTEILNMTRDIRLTLKPLSDNGTYNNKAIYLYNLTTVINEVKQGHSTCI